MKIPLAVYTAVDGFDWQPGTVFSRAELNRYMAMIGKFPDIIFEKIPYGGAFVCDGRFAFYRFHVAERGDSRGRDALYCVLGSVTLAEAKRLDMSTVFNTPEFSAPMRPFPTTVEVSEREPPPAPKSRAELDDRIAGLRMASDVGFYASFFGKGKFDCRLEGGPANPSVRISCENPDIPLPPPPPAPPRHCDSDRRSDDARIREIQKELDRVKREYAEDRQKMEKEIAALRSKNTLLSMALMAILGVAVIFALYKVGADILESHSGPGSYFKSHKT